MKAHVLRMRRQATNWKKIFANCVSEKEVVPRIKKSQNSTVVK